MSGGSHQPVRRRVVGAWLLVAVAGVAALIGLTRAIGLDHPITGPVTPEVVADPDAPDPLREVVPCALPPGREDTPREQPTSAPVRPLEVTSNQLYDCPQTYDGALVRYRGEAVGALLPRDGGVWAQLNDDVYGDQAAPLPLHRDFRGGNAGVGVLLPEEVAADIRSVGGPGQHGDVLDVVGRFHRVDAATGEVAIIRALQGEVVVAGTPLEQPSAPGRRAAALVAVAAAVIAVVVERRTRDRR